MKKDEKIKQTVEWIEGFDSILLEPYVSPKYQVEVGRSLLKLIWFSIHWPVQLWIYYHLFNRWAFFSRIRMKISAFESERIRTAKTWEEYEGSRLTEFLEWLDKKLEKLSGV